MFGMIRASSSGHLPRPCMTVPTSLAAGLALRWQSWRCLPGVGLHDAFRMIGQKVASKAKLPMLLAEGVQQTLFASSSTKPDIEGAWEVNWVQQVSF